MCLATTSLRILATRLPERYDLSSVTRLAVASAPLPPAVANGLLAMLPGARMTSAYFKSEGVPAVVVTTFDPARVHPAIRIPVPPAAFAVTSASATKRCALFALLVCPRRKPHSL
jgi:acyl-coenzyme A synthetase/AMP-(fatty) acid ligase